VTTTDAATLALIDGALADNAALTGTGTADGHGKVTGYFFGLDRIVPVSFELVDASEIIAELVGDPETAEQPITDRLTLWTGAGSALAPRNRTAERLVQRILLAVIRGELSGSARAREKAQSDLSRLDPRLGARGPCLLTGRGVDGLIAPLPVEFALWWERTREAWIAELVTAVALLAGLEPGTQLLAAPPANPGPAAASG
jgi:hypothetical protein